MQYEIFYLIVASKEPELERIKAQVEKIIQSLEGKFLEKEVIEKRKLAYPVRHENYGFYLARRFELEKKESLLEINKKINLYPEVSRFIISRAAELPELKTREERIKESEKVNHLISQDHQAKETGLAQKEKESAKEKGRALEEKPAQEENIDSQLKELLNI